MVGLVGGAICGVGANWMVARWANSRQVVNVAIDAVAHPIGQLFLRLLFAVVVPLVFCSLALGVTNVGSARKIGRLGGRTLAFFLITSAFSVVLGLSVMSVFRPGVGFDEAVRQQLMAAYGGDTDVLRKAAAQNEVGSLLGVVNRILDSVLPRNVLSAAVKMDMLPVIVMALLVGGATATLPEPHKARLAGAFESGAEAMVRIVGFAMKLAPYAVFCLVFSVTARFGVELLRRLAFFVILVLASYLVQLFVLYPILVRTMARMSPIEFMRKALPIIATAFSTSSSNATLPTTMRVAEQELGVRKTVSGFVLPLGATINMNGTALYEGAVVLFVAQIFGVPLSLSQQAVVVLLCVAAAIGTAGIPGGSLPLLMAVMAQVGVPPDGIAIILGVDRLLDMGRTVVNVMGDVACAVWVERKERAEGDSGG
jgi:DAACS family dicarboxylate/amino acid:cation (Na+ or H+) symporter